MLEIFVATILGPLFGDYWDSYLGATIIIIVFAGSSYKTLQNFRELTVMVLVVIGR